MKGKWGGERPINTSPLLPPPAEQPLCLPGRNTVCWYSGWKLEILSLPQNPFRSNLITQFFIWKHFSFPSLLLRKKQGSGNLPPAGKLHQPFLPPEQLLGRRNSSNSCKSSHQQLPPSETTTEPHIKASLQLPRGRINSLTERKQRGCWVCSVNTCIANNPNVT